MKNYFAINLNYLIKTSGLNQVGFASLFNLTQPVVSKYVRNISEPDISFIIAVCRRYKISIDDFLTINLSKRSSINIPLETSNSIKNKLGYPEDFIDDIYSRLHALETIVIDFQKSISKVYQSVSIM